MNERDIFNEIVNLHMPKEIDGWDIHVRMLDDDYKQYNERKILEMKAICREFPRVHTIRTFMPFGSIDEYVSDLTGYLMINHPITATRTSLVIGGDSQ